VSGAGQQDNFSLPTQETDCRAYAAERGWSVVEVYREVHTGADLFGRPQLTLLREAMRQGAFDVLLVHALDRLSRRQIHQGLILSEAEHAGVEWDSVTEDIDNSPQGQILRAVIGGMAEMERLKIAERTIRGRRARAQSGKLLPGKAALYGYRWRDEARGAYDIDPITGPIVQRIFRDVLHAIPLRQIAKRLTLENVPTPSGGTTWSASSIHTMLKRRAYTGEAVAWQYGTEKLRGGRSRVYVRPEEEHTKLPDGTIPALVSVTDFEAVQGRLARNKEAASRNNRAPELTLLRGGYARCGYCGTFLNVTRKKGLVFYRHGTRTADLHGCPAVTIKADRLDEAVWGRVEAILTKPEIIAAEVARTRGTDSSSADLAAIERRVEAVTRKQENLVKRLAAIEDEGVATIVTTELNALVKERRQLLAEQAEAQARHTEWEASQVQLMALEEWCQRVAENLDEFSYDQKRMTLDALGVQVRLFHTDHDPRYEITAAVPLEPDIVSTASSACAASASTSAGRPAGPRAAGRSADPSRRASAGRR
jgi:site-specific DNA recombinase